VAESQIDLDALSQALANAKLHLDEAVKRIPGAGVSANLVGRLRAADDNNSGCNTACSCKAAQAAAVER